MVLIVKEREFTNYDNQLEKEEYSGSITFTNVLNHGILDGKEVWNYHQGLRPADLFKKYNNKKLFKGVRSARATEIFDLKLKFSTALVNDQPSKEQLLKWMPENFTIDSLTELVYYSKSTDYKAITVHLHLKTKEIVYVDFFENEIGVKDITTFLLKEKNYEYMASEHNCDYFNNKENAIQMCPGLDEGTMIDVSKYKN